MFPRYATTLAALVCAVCPSLTALSGEPIEFQARSQVETSPGSGRFHTVAETLEWDPKQTAIIVCDMWNEHWCAGATRRVAEMAPRMNRVCVLGRPFSIRQMVLQGQNVVLMRDMTDTMYNPRSRPRVSHFTGTDLVVGHIERYWCPTITSVALLGGKKFRFSNDRRPHVAIVIGEQEYETKDTLPEWASKTLGQDYRTSYVHADETDRNHLSGLDVLDEADLLLLSVRRRAPRKEQMAAIRKFLEAGKPIVGIRTANHAFSLRGKAPPEGHTVWEDFDAEIIGGNYTNHHGNGPKVDVVAAPGAGDHPILQGVEVSELVGHGSLYKVSPLKESATPLLIGSVPGKPAEPIAWTNTTKFGGRAFYTSLGHKEEFKQPPFRKFLANAVTWALAKEAAAAEPGS